MIIIQATKKTTFVNEGTVQQLTHDKEKKKVWISFSDNNKFMVEDVVVVRYTSNTEVEYVDRGNELETAEGTLCHAKLKLDWFRRREKCYRDIVSRYQSTLRTVLSDASNKAHDEETLRAAIDKTVMDTFKDVDSIRKFYNQEECEKMEHFGEPHRELIV